MEDEVNVGPDHRKKKQKKQMEFPTDREALILGTATRTHRMWKLHGGANMMNKELKRRFQ